MESKLMIPEVYLRVLGYSLDLCPLYNKGPSTTKRLHNDMGTQDKYSLWDSAE